MLRATNPNPVVTSARPTILTLAMCFSSLFSISPSFSAEMVFLMGSVVG
jgi:hypothetical protein